MKMKWILALTSAIVALSCNSGNKSTVTTGTNPVQLIYSDGNGNQYRVDRNSFEYIPVKRSESGTGQYDGGEAMHKQTGSAAFEKLLQLIADAEKAVEEQVKERAKGTGRIEINENGSSRYFILNMNSSKKKILEDHLRAMKK